MPFMMEGALDQESLEQQLIEGQNVGNDINMDDLFGDDPSVTVSLPMDKRLPRRLSELHESGCSQRIGWSKYGPIAAITQDSRAVKAYCLIRESKTGRWQLSKAAPLKIPEGHDLEFKHVSWSFMGSDLAIVDARGRILIYNCALGHCHMDLRRDCSNDANDEMSSIVGMHWLPPYPAASKVTAYWSAISEGGKWTWNRDEHKGTGPSNPVEGKTALFCMNRGGRLRLLYQLADGHWRECVALVDDATYDSERYITHASFAPENDDKHMQLVTYDSHYTLRLYTVEVNWGASKDAQESQGKSLSLNPSLKVSPVDVEPHCVPNGTDQTDPADMAGLGLGDGIHYVLTHLEIVPPALDTGSAGQRLNSVLAVFKNVPLVIPSTNDGTQPSSLSPSTLVWTWQLQPATTGNLSSSFDQLSAKKKSTDSVKTKSSLTLIKQESNAFLNTVLLVTPLRYNTIIALTMADGSVEFLRRDSMQPIQADYNDSEVYSLPQSGFAFMSGESVVNVELSPNGCMQAYQDLEGKLKLRTITSTASDLVNPVSAERRKAIATSLALQWASGLLQMRSFLDDILALLVPNADPELIFEFTEQAVNAMGHNLDFSADDPQKPTIMLFRTPWLQRFFGTQAALGMTRHGRRTLAAKLALVTLNVRLSAFVIMMSFRHDLSLKSEVAVSLCGTVQWTLDFMVYCLQEIDRLSEHLLAQPDEGDKHALITAFCAAENSPALLILFSSISRVLIRLICRPLRHGWIHCINGAKTATNPTQKAHFLRVIEVYNKSPVCTSQAAPPHPGQPSTSIPAITFELFSAQVDSLIKDAYTAAGMSDAQRAAAEKEMFVRATIPDALFPAIMKLLTETWPRFIQQPGFDLGRAVKHDVAWLGFTEDRYTRAWQARHVVDVVRKTVLPRDARVRYCARCGSGMEDIVPSERYPGWVIGSMKNCLCLGNWGIVERKG